MMTDDLFFERFPSMVIFFIGFLQILLFVFCLICIFKHSAVHADSSLVEEQSQERYMSIQVRSGESLWEISRRYYSSEYKSMNHYIRKIMSLNHMTDDNINTGAYLIIPYYDMEQQNATT